LLFLFCSERAQNKKTQPCGAYRLMKLLLVNRLQASRRREGFFRCRPLTGNGNDFPLCVLCASKERSEWAVNYYTFSLPKGKHKIIDVPLSPYDLQRSSWLSSYSLNPHRNTAFSSHKSGVHPIALPGHRLYAS